MRPVTSADYLYQDVLENEVPTDPKVRQDYWFDRCHVRNEESYLLGVFAGLVHYRPNHITREELHQWRSDARGHPYLVMKIVEKFEELPDSGRGGYFPWFLRHRTRFELLDGHPSISRAPSPMTQQQNMEAKARKYLALEDQHKDITELTPFAKMHCFIFYAMLRNNSYPPPMNSVHCHWFDFGFVISHDQHEERVLTSMYNTMLFGSTSYEEYERSIGSSTTSGWVRMGKRSPTCSFNEFWEAWEREDLMALFNKCWPDLPAKDTILPTEYNLLARLRVFLETETPRPPIWRLRHFLALKDISVESANTEIGRAARDYGFSEQLDTRTTMDLRDFYVQLLKKVEPSAIHRERMKGNLMQYAEGYVDNMTTGVKEVLHGLL
jgi:hypothetical protein